MVSAPTTYGCSPSLLLTKPARSVAAVAASASSEALPVSQVNVHPLVLLSVLDHHTRRQEGAGRVIGTLLGKRDGDTVSFQLMDLVRGGEEDRISCVVNETGRGAFSDSANQVK